MGRWLNRMERGGRRKPAEGLHSLSLCLLVSHEVKSSPPPLTII